MDPNRLYSVLGISTYRLLPNGRRGSSIGAWAQIQAGTDRMSKDVLLEKPLIQAMRVFYCCLVFIVVINVRND